MASSKDKQKFPSSGRVRVDRNIYREVRSADSVRYKVAVSGQPVQTRTFDLVDEDKAKAWAYGIRADLAGKASPAVAVSARRSPAPARGPVASGAALLGSESNDAGNLEAISVKTILDRYRTVEVPKLAASNRGSVLSRLNILTKTFGHLKLGELTKGLVSRYRDDRLAGLYGEGRSYADRAEHHGLASGKYKSKSAAYYERKRHKARGGSDETAPVRRKKLPSTQTVRHELRLLKLACKTHFDDDSMEEHSAWLATRPFMATALPPPAAPRKRRLSREEERNLYRQVTNPEIRSVLTLALSLTLRRAEVLSLRWEDLKLSESTIKLWRPKGPGGSKTTERDVPLTPDAIATLTEMGIKKRGKIFSVKLTSCTQAVRRAADRIGLSDFRLHDSRREAVSRLNDIGIAPATITVFTGHTSEEVLRRHYLQPDVPLVAQRVAQVFAEHAAKAAAPGRGRTPGEGAAQG